MDRKLVRKSNYLIEASYKLSAVEQKIILILASMIKPEDREFKSYPLKIKNITEMMGLESKNDYAYIKESTRNLMGKVFTISTAESELQTHWFSSVEYFEGRGEVEFSFDPKLKPFLLQLKERFTTYRLREAVQLKSSFSIRMLELLRQYEKIGERILEVRKLRSLLGIGDDQYRLYGDFKKRVIIQAQKELSAKTDISFEFEEIKNGHAVEKLRFTILSKEETGPEQLAALVLQPPVDPELQRLLQMLPGEYQAQKSLQRILTASLKKSGFDFVARNIVYANEKSHAANPGGAAGKSGNYRNYLAKALKGDFGLAFQEDRTARQAKEEKARGEKAVAEAALQQTQEKARRDQEDMDRARIYQDSLPPEALTHLREEAFSRLDSRQQDLVRRKGPGAEMTIKLMMTRISLERMKISSPSASPASQETPEPEGEAGK